VAVTPGTSPLLTASFRSLSAAAFMAFLLIVCRGPKPMPPAGRIKLGHFVRFVEQAPRPRRDATEDGAQGNAETLQAKERHRWRLAILLQ
jgi:hypothetical protein